MVSSDKVLVSPRRSHEQNASAPQFIWRTYDLPYEYIGANWPIRVSFFFKVKSFKGNMLFYFLFYNNSSNIIELQYF
jgi:hypothetical protein